MGIPEPHIITRTQLGMCLDILFSSPLKIETDRGIPKIYRFEFRFGEDKTHHRLQMQCSQASWILRDHLGQFVMVQ
jgi:hypothetical protein